MRENARQMISRLSSASRRSIEPGVLQSRSYRALLEQAPQLEIAEV